MPCLPRALPLFMASLLGAGCAPGSDIGPDAGGDAGPEVDVGHPLTTDFTQPEALTQALERFEQDTAISRAEFDALYSVSFDATLDYDPTTAAHLDLIQASILGLDATGQQTLADQGFVIAADPAAPTFAYAYQTLYALDLPVYITVDSLLDVMHVRYDAALAALERQQLRSALDELLTKMRQPLQAVEQPDTVRLDADLYLSVARSLLDDDAGASVYDANAAQVASLVEKAKAAGGVAKVSLFGVVRELDFSQFMPRGHYAGDPELETYFRAMMWLGRVDLRLIEPVGFGKVMTFRRRQFELMALLAQLLEPARDLHARIDEAIATFVGEPDFMTPGDATRLARELGEADLLAAAAELEDDALAQALHDGGHGLQRIAGHVLEGAEKPGDTAPLPVSFALLGQRYVVDSEVFSNVVWDRIDSKRMMPDPLDAAFAALGNDQAAVLLAEPLDQYTYHGALHAVRKVIDGEEEGYWQRNLYNRWLSALRALSPSPEAEGLPAPLRGEPWGRRLLLSQLASWAQLRHDTLLYAKQSYTATAICEFPDAYVDPYPEAFEAIRGMLGALADTLGDWGVQVGPLDTEALAVVQRLADIARYEREGEALRAEDLAWINQMIDALPGCDGAPFFNGWYGRTLGASPDFDPTIADVHTQPTDEGGRPVGRVLHVGTGMVRYMVTSLDTPQGVRAFVAPVFGYRELVTEDFDRWDDARWAAALEGAGAGATPDWAPVTGPLGSAEPPQLTYCSAPF